ncbi:MAG: YceI family protein, partial [Robiginitalea sp.]|uniref:YceI family protein n=1 Tax=Robiginitalea sp. TaxID=1902411 RepID=UPI003C74B8C5
MKRTFLTLALAVFALGTTQATEPVEIEKKEVKTKESKVAWKAYKVTGSHNGTVDLKSGTLMFDNDKLTGGEFTVDMTTLVATDLEGESRQKLEGHLKSDDFFSVASNPNATLVFTNVKSTGKNSYEVTGNLTVKNITKPVTFDVSVYGSKATATMKVDRTQFEVKYGSGSFFDDLGDKTI